MYRMICVYFTLCVWPAYMYVYHVFTWSQQRSEEGARSSGTVVTEPPCRCWKPSPGPLQEQRLLLPDKPSLQIPSLMFMTILMSAFC